MFGLLSKVVGTTRRVITLTTGIPTTTSLERYIDHADFTRVLKEFDGATESETENFRDE